MKINFSLKGDKALAERLSQLSKSEFKKVIKDGAKKSLEPVQQMARSIAPKETGKLRRAIRIRVLKRSRKRIGARVTIGSADNMFKGKTFYGAFQEYGWRAGKRATNADIGVAKRKRRTRAQRAEISQLNNSRTKIEGKRYLQKSVKAKRQLVFMTFGGWVRKMIHKAVKRRKT